MAVTQDDPRAQPLLDELAVEYAQRYESTPQTVMTWLTAVPIAEFAPPDGGFLIGEVDGVPGHRRRVPAIRRGDGRAQTDLDRQAHRRRGFATALLVELEATIAARGYRRVYLTTGNRQPEAEALYESSWLHKAFRANAIAGTGLSDRLCQGFAMTRADDDAERSDAEEWRS